MKSTLTNSLVFCAIGALSLSGCSTNPVTGEKQVMLVSKSQQISLGEENYSTMQQSQGGVYQGSPELSELVKEVGHKLVKVSDQPDLPYQFVIVNEGTPNAWALPGGKIAVHRGLLTELNSEAELAAVLSHEIVHAAAQHGASSMQKQILISGGLMGASMALDQESNYTKAGLMAASIAGQAALQKYSRDNELEADHYGMEYMKRAGYNPYAAVSLQETFVKLKNGKKENWLQGLFASHPPSQERVKANQVFAQELNGPTYEGKERYQQALAKLKQQQPAYEHFNQAQTALNNKQSQKALQDINLAIQKVPNEYLFYSLKGDALLQQNQQEQALEAYEQALSKNKHYFYPYLQKGLIYKQKNMNQEALSYLKQAQTLLPTEVASKAIQELSSSS